MIDPDAAVLSHYSLRFAAPAERFAAARQAGFSAVGFGVKPFLDCEAAGLSGPDLARMAASEDLTISEIEALKPWWGDPKERAASIQAEETVWRMADVFGSRYVQAIGPYYGTIDDAADAFARLCDRAADHGVVVGIEFLPFTNITDARTAAAIVDLAGRPNGGVCVDAWHHFRGAADPEQVRELTARRIVAVQIDDGTLVPEDEDYYTDCLENRRVPGEGEFDLVGFMGLLDEIGVDVPVSIEVISSDLQSLSAEEAARRMRLGFLKVLEQARS